MEGKNDHDKSVITLPGKDKVKENSEIKLSKEFKSLSPKPYMPPLPFLQRFVKAKLDCNLLSFLMCFRSCM